MPRIGEIFSEGIEHVRRSGRRFRFEQQLKAAERMSARALRTIGEAGWRLRIKEGIDCDAWKELERIEQEGVLLREDAARKTDHLREQMNEERRRHLDLENAGGTADVDLEELGAKRTSLLAEINKYERELSAAKEDEARQNTAKATLTAARAALSDIDAEIDKIQKMINRTATDQSKMLQRAESLEKEEAAVHRGVEKRESELEKASAPHFLALGRHLLDNRPDSAEMAPLFARYDLAATTAENTRYNIESERRLIDLLDQASVTWFYGIAIGGALVFIAILVLLLLWLIPALW